MIDRWLYDPSLWRFPHKLHQIVKRHLYVPYVRELRAAGELIRAAGGKVEARDTIRTDKHTLRLRLLMDMVQHRSFLVVTDAFAL